MSLFGHVKLIELKLLAKLIVNSAPSCIITDTNSTRVELMINSTLQTIENFVLIPLPRNYVKNSISIRDGQSFFAV